MIVAIAGATGLTGSLTLHRLLMSPRVTKVLSIGRRPTGIAHPKLSEVPLVDGQVPSNLVADAFVCCLGTTIKKAGSQTAFRAVDLELPLHLAKGLRREGCQSLAVVSAMGADPKSHIFYNRTKGEMEAGLQELVFRSLVILRPALIEGPRLESRPGEKWASFFMKALNPLLIGGLRHYRPIRAEAIADGLVRAVTHPQPGTRVVRSGDIATFAQSL